MRNLAKAQQPLTRPQIRGLDVYDPTTGELRSSSVDDIAAWFLHTDYDGDAFFVRHAYFTGAVINHYGDEVMKVFKAAAHQDGESSSRSHTG